MRGHVISRTRLCCRPFVTMCRQMHLCRRLLPGVFPSLSINVCAHTCVLQKAGVRVRCLRLRGLRMFLRVRQYMCGRSKQSPAVTVSCEGVRCDCSPAACVRCTLVSLPEARARCHGCRDCGHGACVFTRTHMFVAN